MHLPIIQKRRWFYGLSLILVIGSIVALSVFGLRLGTDFTGGSLLEVQFTNAAVPNSDDLRGALTELELGDITIQPSDDDKLLLRFREVSEEEHQAVLTAIGKTLGDTTTETTDGEVPEVVELRFDSIGPTIGQELRQKSVWASVVVLGAIIAYIAWAFRKVSRPVKSWKYGVIAIIALLHDVLITCGVFALLGYFFGIEIGAPFVAAILTVIGYSVNDTIVIFDRTRENLYNYHGDFAGTVNKAVNATIGRSINASVTTLLVLLAVFFFGGATIQPFVTTLIIGVVAGTYSSIFLASPLLVSWKQLSQRG